MTKPLKKERFICLDAEMTGLNLEEDRIIELAAIRFSLEEGIIDCFETLVDPKIPIPEESILIHKITPEMLEGKPTIDQVLPEFFAFLQEDIIVGHQIGSDITIIANEAKRKNIPTHITKHRLIDTLRLARSYGDSPNNSLNQLAKHFNVPVDDKHRAKSDVMTNIGVFKHLVHRYKTTEELFQLLASPVKMKYMPLGKYKGRLFADIPRNYLQWAVNMDFDQDLIYTIRTELKKRAKSPGFSEASNPFKQLG